MKDIVLEKKIVNIILDIIKKYWLKPNTIMSYPIRENLL